MIVRVGVTHSPNSTALLPSPAGTALMTRVGERKNMRGLSFPPAGCALVRPVVATTESGRGSVARKHAASVVGTSALNRVMASAIVRTSPAFVAQARSASLVG